jgi:hypothetical protein
MCILSTRKSHSTAYRNASLHWRLCARVCLSRCGRYPSTGSCYVVLRKGKTLETIHTTFSCELHFDAVSEGMVRLGGVGSRASAYSEVIPIHNLELSTSD